VKAAARVEHGAGAARLAPEEGGVCDETPRRAAGGQRWFLCSPLPGIADHFRRGQDLHRRVAPNQAIAGVVHEWGVYALLALLVAHAGAAFYHHYELKDAVLRRMAPWIKPAA
jgi:hypothetical protein